MSFFGVSAARPDASATASPSTPHSSFDVHHLGAILSALADAAGDSDANVRTNVSDALISVAKHQPVPFLSSTIAYLQQRRTTLSKTHKSLLYSTIDSLYQIDHRFFPDSDLVPLGALCLEEMVYADYPDVIASQCCKLLKTLPEMIVGELLIPHYPSGVLPNLYVLEASEILRQPRFVRDALTKLMPILAVAKTEAQLIRLCALLRAFAEENRLEAEYFSAADFLLSKWIGHKESTVRSAAACAVGKLSTQLSQRDFDNLAPKLILAYVNLLKKDCKKEVDSGIIRGLADFMQVVGPLIVEPQLKELVPILTNLAKMSYTTSDMELLRVHYEVLRLFEGVVRNHPDVILASLQKIMEVKEKDPSAKLSSLSVLRYLITRNNIEPARIISLLLAAARTGTNEAAEVEQAMSQTILALGGTGSLLLEGGRDLLRLLVRRGDPSLWLFTSTCESAPRVLWPWILDQIVDPANEAHVNLLMKCAVHASRALNEPFTKSTPPVDALVAKGVRYRNNDFVALFVPVEDVHKSPSIAPYFTGERCLADAGKAMALVESRAQVSQWLDQLFTQYYLEDDVSEPFAIVSAVHLDLVLERVSFYMRNKWGKKREDEIARVRCCGIYGRIPLCADAALFRARCEAHVLSPLVALVRTSKIDAERSEALKALESVAGHLLDLHCKEDVLRTVLGTIAQGNAVAEGLLAVRALLAIPKPATKTIQLNILAAVLAFSSSAPHQVESVLIELLQGDISIAALYSLLQALEQQLFTTGQVGTGARFYVSLLKHFAARVVEDSHLVSESALTGYGLRIAALLPHCDDSRIVEAIYLLLRIDFFLRGTDHVPDALTKLLAHANGDASSADVTALLAYALLSHSSEWMPLLLSVSLVSEVSLSFVSNFLVARGADLSPSDLESFARRLIIDTLPSCPEPAIPGVLTAIRGLARHDVLKIFRMILEAPDAEGRNMVRAMQSLSMDSQLRDRILADLCRHLPSVTREDVAQAITRAAKHIFSIKNATNMVGDEHRVDLFVALILRLGIADPAFQVASANQVQPRSTSPSAASASAAIAFANARAALQNFLAITGVSPAADSDAIIAEGAENVERIVDMYLARYSGDAASLYAHLFSAISRLEHAGLIVIATGGLASLLHYYCNAKPEAEQSEMISALTHALLLKTGMDEAVAVRKLAFLGLGHIADSQSGCLTHATAVLAALLSHADCSSTAAMIQRGVPPEVALNVQLTSQGSMLRILAACEPRAAAGVSVNICLRVRSTFDAEDPRVREGGLRIFCALQMLLERGREQKHSQGDAVVIEVQSEAFEEQVFANMPAVLVHMEDPVAAVRSAAKSVFRAVVPSLHSEDLVALSKERSLEEGVRLDWSTFVDRFSERFVQDLPDRVGRLLNGVLVYVSKSRWAQVRSSSAVLVAALAAAARVAQVEADVDAVVHGLIQAVAKDAAAEVRAGAARALGRLHMC